jgi:hypothetical protein
MEQQEQLLKPSSQELGLWILSKLSAYAELLKRLNDRTNAQEKRLRELVEFITKDGM